MPPEIFLTYAKDFAFTDGNKTGEMQFARLVEINTFNKFHTF